MRPPLYHITFDNADKGNLRGTGNSFRTDGPRKLQDVKSKPMQFRGVHCFVLGHSKYATQLGMICS
jgi:hypothetical protein